MYAPSMDKSSAERAEYIDIEPIDQLVASLNKLKDNGGRVKLSEGEFWYGPSRGKGFLNDVKHAMQALKIARGMLGAMVQTITDEITAITHEILPICYHHGFASLPDELIEYILEESGNDPVEMQMVSWRLYRIVSSLPRLWTTIVHKERGARWNLALKRSCEQTLDVEIFVDKLTAREVQALRPHWHRVGRLRLDHANKQMELMNSQFSSLGTMHRLRYLSLDLRCTEVDDPSEYTFYKDWHTPNLTELAVTNIIPMPIRGMSLRHLDMLLSFAYFDLWDVTKLNTLLTSCQCLERMSIDIKDAALLIGEFGPVELPLLRYFKLTLAKDVVSNNPSFVGFASNITITNVEEMHIVTVNLAEADVTPCVELIFSSSTRYPNLTILDFSVKRTGSCDLMISHGTILARLLKLSYFTIEAPELDILVEDILSATPFPPLKSICFRRCYRADLDFFKLLFLHLQYKIAKREEGSPDHKIVVQVNGCSHLPKESVEHLGGKSGIRVEWKS